MAEVLGPEGLLCAGTPYTLEALDAGSCLTLRWVVVGTPAAVSDDDVIFTAPESLVTSVTVPLEGNYQFAFECCSEA